MASRAQNPTRPWRWLVAALSISAPAAQVQAEGLYLRVGVGPSYGLGELATDDGESGSDGVGVSTQIGVGWSVRPGLVVGLGTFPAVTPSPTYDGVDAGGQHVSGTGPFVAYHPALQGGLNLQAGLLLAAGYLDGGDRGGAVGFGPGATASVGWDHELSGRWAIGGAARLTLYQLRGVDDTFRLLAPAALLTLTRR